MLTDANFAANRATLTSSLVSQMGLSVTPSDWTYDQRIAFNKAFAAYVIAHPDSFSATDLNTANGIAGESPTALDDTSLSADLSAFGSAVTDNVVAAGNQVAGIGNGVLNLASAAQYIIPVAGVIIVGILLYGFFRKQAR